MKLHTSFLTLFIFSFGVNALPSRATRQVSSDLVADYTYTEAHVVEPRQVAEIAAISAAADLGYKIGGYIGDTIVGFRHKIGNDKKMRAGWTKDMVNQLKSQYPGFNFVVCHSKHRTSFGGHRNVDWFHAHKEVKVSFHKTVGYEIYWFKEGTFELLGDGGLINWAYAGRVKNKNFDGTKIVFARP